MIYQLRTYEVFEHNKAAFHERFRDHASRIMGTYGFTIVAIWESRHEAGTEFLYLLEWPDVGSMTASWDSFLADEEWKAIKRETAARHGDLVGDIQSRVLETVPYSPGRLG